MSSIGNLVFFGGTLVYARWPLNFQYLDKEGPRPHWLNVTIFVFQIGVILALLGAFMSFAYIASVVLTLTAVEESDTNTSIRQKDQDSNSSYKDDEDLKQSNPKPANAGFRSTIRYLRSRGGIRACFRGFRMTLAIYGAELAVSIIWTFIPMIRLMQPIWPIFLSLLTATWQMAWVHQVIANKLSRSRPQRLLGFHNWSKVAHVAALQAISFYVADAFFAVAVNFAQEFAGGIVGVDDNASYESVFLFAAICIVAGLLCVLITLPALITFTRVAASMLPGEDDPIVPYDRTFDGKVKSESMGGTGRIGIKDAWYTFEKPAWEHYVKLSFTTYGILFPIAIAGVIVLLRSSVIAVGI
ncbi:hypothetical protein N7456_012537 [Penicillium angulare]|uniref:Uncharacterized protein n=1 Tax=Penicillium angulare TaxID=116970 RepID=A0A9W9K182_9EURO|nr:hypothetical protein N7456_012537 [Penicillium angulare]